MSSGSVPPGQTARSHPWLTPAVRGFSAASFFSDLGHEMVTSLLPGFLTALGAPPIGIGLVEGISQLAQAGGGLVGGTLASDSPRRQTWVVIGYVATAIKAALALVWWWPWAILIRTAAWTGRGLRGPIRNTVITEEVPAAHRGKAFGFREAWDTAGAVLGPVAALLLIHRIATRALFAWSVIPGLLAVVMVLIWVRAGRPPRSTETRPRLSPRPIYRKSVLALAQWQLGWVAPTLFILRVERSGIAHGVMLAIALYILHNIAYAAASYPAGVWADRMSTGRLLVGTGCLGALTLLGFAWPGVHLLLWAVLFVAAGVVTAFWETVQKPWLLLRMDPNDQGRGFGRAAAALGVSQLISNIVITALWTWLGPVLAFAAAAGLAAQGTVRLWRADRSGPDA